MKCICSLRSPEGCGRKGPVWPIHGCNKVLINYDAQCSRVAAPLTSGAPCAETRVEPSSTARQVSAKPSMKRTSDRAKEKLHKHIRKALQETGARREIRRSGCFASGELRTRQSAKVRLQKTTLNLRGLRPRRQCEKATKRKTYALQNSPQRLSCIRRAVLATGAAGHRLEHDIKSARPAAAATARNCQKKQKP